MALVSRTIPNLVQGVSQQPEVLRLNSQAGEQINGFSSVVEGLKKRPPTEYNLFVKEQMLKLKNENPELKNKDLLGEAAKLWNIHKENKLKKEDE